MITDALLQLSAAQAVTVTAVSTNTIDLMQMSGTWAQARTCTPVSQFTLRRRPLARPRSPSRSSAQHQPT